MELRLEGRTEDELLDRPLFACCDRYEDVETVSESGLRCGSHFLNSCLGQFHGHSDVDDDVTCPISNVSADATPSSSCDVILPCLFADVYN